MKKQKVVRTYPDALLVSGETNEDLEKALDEGYKVVMCNKMNWGNKDYVVLEYILEKDE